MTLPSLAAWPAGFFINDVDIALPDDIAAAFHNVPTSFVSDAMGRGTGTIGMRAYGRISGFSGPARTVRTRPGDNLMIHKAAEMIRPGDVLVIDGAGSIEQGIVGGNIRLHLIQRGCAGLIVFGAIRDVDDFTHGDLPTLAMGVNHRGPTKDGPGEINVPIACAGMTVQPGDIVIGDSDGAVAVSRDQAATVISRLQEVIEKEEKSATLGRSGSVPTGRFDEFLRAKGCPI